MARRFRKRRKFVRRIKRGRMGFRKFRRGLKGLIRRKQKATWRTPRNHYAAPQAFAKLRTEYMIKYDKDSPIPVDSYMLDHVFVGNSLFNDFSVNTDEYAGAPAWQLAQFYRRFYVWKTKVTVEWADISINLTTNRDAEPRTLCIHPNTSSGSVYTKANVGWTRTVSGIVNAPGNMAGIRQKSYLMSSMNYTRNPLKLSATFKTQKLFKMKADVERDFTGRVEPSGNVTDNSAQLSITAPNLQYWIHIFVIDWKETNTTINANAKITIDYYTRFFDRRTNLVMNTTVAG